MIEMPNETSAALRARWLAELAIALDAALELVKQLGCRFERIEAAELHERIESVRREVLAMRQRRFRGAVENFDPEWTENLPWKHSA